jgi:antitoxin component of MazEF toxin-antitoxin module
MKIESYILTKKIAKHGNQAVIVIPSILNRKLKPQMLVRVQIDVLDDGVLQEAGK